MASKVTAAGSRSGRGAVGANRGVLCLWGSQRASRVATFGERPLSEETGAEDGNLLGTRAGMMGQHSLGPPWKRSMLCSVTRRLLCLSVCLSVYGLVLGSHLRVGGGAGCGSRCPDRLSLLMISVLVTWGKVSF